MSDNSVASGLDEFLGVVAARYRRWTLHVMMDHEVGTLGELITVVWVLSEAVADTEADRRRITIRLQQIHLPKLAEAGLLHYDRRSGEIALTEKADEFHDQLAVIAEWEKPAVQEKLRSDEFPVEQPVTDSR